MINGMKNTLVEHGRITMILDDQYITKDMLTKDSYKGNNYAYNNAVMFDLQNGKQNVLCFCDNKHTAEAIAEALNLLDRLESDGAELRHNNTRGIK